MQPHFKGSDGHGVVAGVIHKIKAFPIAHRIRSLGFPWLDLHCPERVSLLRLDLIGDESCPEGFL